MPSKVIWLASLVTLAYWLGNIVGCSTTGDNQNLQILGEDAPLFDTSPDPERPGARRAPEPVTEDVQTAQAATTDDLPVATEAPQTTQAEERLAATPDETDPAATPADEAAAEPAVGTERSFVSLDRSHWPRLATGPSSGRIVARPHYFEDWPLAEASHGQAERQPLDGADAAGWDKANSRAAFAQPVKFSMDLVMFPVRLAAKPLRRLQASIPFDELRWLPFLSGPTPDAEPAAQ